MQNIKNDVELPKAEFLEIVEKSFRDGDINQYMYAYKKNFEDRIIYVDSEVESSAMVDYTRLILYYNRVDKEIPVEERKPIKIFVYSYGGDVNAAWHFIDICLLSKTPIYTYNIGCALSAGLSILLAGSKRYALKNSIALCHRGSVFGLDGDMNQVTAYFKLGEERIKDIFSYITERTGKITKKMLDKKTVSDWYINSKEQLSLGIVHEIIEDIDCML